MISDNEFRRREIIDNLTNVKSRIAALTEGKHEVSFTYRINIFDSFGYIFVMAIRKKNRLG